MNLETNDCCCSLYFVGKGVTYDTGGADIKCSGHMRDMSRDKCGAAAVAGFFKTVSLLAPTKVNVTGGLALVRNSVGPDMYVSDEIIVARSGKRGKQKKKRKEKREKGDTDYFHSHGW